MVFCQFLISFICVLKFSKGDGLWPGGNYALPMHTFGCPDPSTNNWHHGYMTITFKDRTELYEDSVGRIGWNGTKLNLLELLGPYGSHSIQLNFCNKVGETGENEAEWPTGNYSLYGIANRCPSGFTEVIVNRTVPEIMFVNRDGYLPDIHFHKDENHSVISFITCQKVSGETGVPKPSRNGSSPLILLSLDEQKQQKSEQFLRRLYLMTIGNLGMTYRYEWLNYYVVGFEAPKMNLDLDHYLDNATIVYASEERQSRGTTFRELSNYIDEEDVLILCDLGKSTVVSGIVLWKSWDSILQAHSEISPVVYVSESKWSFLRNGAHKCLTYIAGQETVWTLIHCWNTPTGRYVALVFPRAESVNKITMLNYLDVKQFITSKESPRCNRPMGMRDKAILDFQLTSSSATPKHQPSDSRPQGTGWCAQIEDSKPYLQIDFLASVNVEGIQIFIWQEHETEKLKNSSEAFAFWTEYGTDISSLSQSNQTFYLDPFLPPKDVQMIEFVSPLLTRYLRIYPMPLIDLNTPICLRFEVIGCQASDPYNRICVTNHTREWFFVRNLYLSTEEYDSLTQDFVNTSSDCLEYCETNIRRCQSALYNNESDFCQIFQKPSNNNYGIVSLDAEDSSNLTFLGVCDTGTYIVAQTGILNTMVKVDWRQKTPLNPGVLVSSGYPLYYPSGTVIIWTISVSEGNFIQFLLSNFSLNKYKMADDDIYKCEDGLYFLPATSSNTYDFLNNIEFIRTGRISIYNTRTVLLTSAQNNQQISLKAFWNVTQVVFRTRDHECKILEHGNGFRMLGYSTDDVQGYQEGYIVSFIKLPWSDKTLKSPEILMSQGYPTYYPTKAATIWTITVPKGKYVNLLISDFSLNKYKTASDSTSNMVCKDGLYFEQSSLSMIALWYLYDFIVTGKIDEHSIRILHFTALENSRQASLKFRGNIVQVVLRTCGETREIVEMGHGFRLLVYSSDIPTCARWGYHRVKELSLCRWKAADIVSTSFLGIFFKAADTPEDSEFNFWTLEGTIHEYLILQITDFDVGCETGTIFEIDDGQMISRRCNHNKPVYRIVSKLNTLLVRFQLKSCGSHILVEGFKANYKTEIKNTYILSMVSSEETDTDQFDQPSLKVCSASLNKCYVMLDLEDLKIKDSNHDITWNLLRTDLCGKYNWSIVSMHSKLEQDFISYYLQHRLQYQTRRHLELLENYYGFAYLGLRRNQSRFFWDDGSPLTFTSWATGHPIKSLDCTRFNIRLLPAEITWESVSCDDMQAEYGICEYPLKDFNISRRTVWTGSVRHVHLSSFVNMTRLEMSVYFHCGDGEMISILGRCDENKDCLSGRDEENCNSLSSICNVDQYRCKNGKCIDISAVCDFHSDCTEGEDEDCYFSECKEDEFTCHSKACIDGNLRCDGKQDCLSGEDEMSCSTCNQSTSFNCGDVTCIPLSYRCDGIPDCLSEEDENNCVKPDTCQGWWNAGYRENGMYNVHGEEMECDFDEIHTTGRIITKYHRIDYLDIEGKRAFLNTNIHFGSMSILFVLHQNYECFQTIDQLCQPWLQELYHIDKNGTGGQNSRCQCLRWKKQFGDFNGQYEDCDTGAQLPATNSDLMIFDTTLPFSIHFAYSLKYSSQEAEPPDDIRVRINPIVCYKDFIQPPLDIVCGNGITVTNEVRCLYDVTEFGTINGCRNLAHLQDCGTWDCPEGFFKCSESFCLKNRFICDGEKQCEKGDDEENCGTPEQICASQNRCLQSNICLPVENLCDGYRQCPLGDDERLCHFRCPHGCICKGMTADCRMVDLYNNMSISLTENVKSLDISTNSEFFISLSQREKKLFYLSFLNMSWCAISKFPSDFFLSMRNLRTLDLRYNRLQIMSSEIFINQNKLKSLLLAGNKHIHIIESRAFEGLHSIKNLKLSNSHIGRLSKHAFKSLSLETLDISNNKIDTIDNDVFQELSVRNLFMNATEIRRFDQDMFAGINIANKLVTGAFRFCCIRPVDLPEENCYPRKDEFSSCADLMRNDVLRSLLWIIGLFSLVGNAASLIYRFIYDRERQKLGYGIFVTNLAISDFLMGIYLITIASADVAFRGTYIYHDEAWRNSFWCSMAGILSTVSSEASVLFICLITLDRILVIKFPFGQVRLTTKISILGSCVVWIVVALIAVMPLIIKSYFKHNFYSKSGVCLALPLTRDRPPGWIYSVSIFIGFNFVTFLVIAFGQCLIYRAINESKMKVKSCSTGRANDLRVARNLLLVASTDFLCWFPIGILGILALTNHAIPGEVYAWTAVLVLPINSALNPFLYTLSAILGQGKFTPDKDEQARSEVIPIDILDKHVELWNSKLFMQPLFAKCLPPLQKRLETNLKPDVCLGIIVAITKCINKLHERDISQSDLSLEKFYMYKTRKGYFTVALSLTPKIVKKDDEKKQEIKNLGIIINAVVHQFEKSIV